MLAVSAGGVVWISFLSPIMPLLFLPLSPGEGSLQTEILCQRAITVKILKIGTPEIITIIGLTIGIVGFHSAVLCSKDANRITNREDPDQTAP